MINTMEVNPEELPALDLFQNCRLCLAKEKVSVDIFSEGHEIRLLYYKIVSCFPVNVTQDDKLPRKICTQCNQKVDDFYQFWTLTAKSQKTLLEWVEKRELLPPAKIKTENDAPGQVSFKQEAMDYSDDDNDLDRYDDDNSEEENNVQPTALVKVCEEGEEGATTGAAAGPSTANIKSSHKKESKLDEVTKDPTEKFKCEVCERCFRNTKLLDTHVAYHQDAPFTCDLCKCSFKKKRKLRSHISSHSDRKLFACDLCGKRFKVQISVENHKLTVHNGIERSKPFQCSSCSKSFYTKTKLEDHQHVHTGVKSYVCHICAMSFASNSCLSNHVKIVHEGKKRTRPKQFCQCEICGKSFTFYTHYRRHLENIHGDGKPTCNVCGKVVSSKEFLKTHMNMHTGETPYHCLICLMSFRARSSFTGHYKSKHPGIKPPDTKNRYK